MWMGHLDALELKSAETATVVAAAPVIMLLKDKKQQIIRSWPHSYCSASLFAHSRRLVGETNKVTVRRTNEHHWSA